MGMDVRGKAMALHHPKVFSVQAVNVQVETVRLRKCARTKAKRFISVPMESRIAALIARKRFVCGMDRGIRLRRLCLLVQSIIRRMQSNAVRSRFVVFSRKTVKT